MSEQEKGTSVVARVGVIQGLAAHVPPSTGPEGPGQA